MRIDPAAAAVSSFEVAYYKMSCLCTEKTRAHGGFLTAVVSMCGSEILVYLLWLKSICTFRAYIERNEVHDIPGVFVARILSQHVHRNGKYYE